MWCLAKTESTEWSRAIGRRVTKSRDGPIRLTEKHIVTVPLSNLKWSRLQWFSGFVASSVGPFDNCLLWVTEWSVWPSSEIWHLFYRLREGYAERRALIDAPGHLFLRHETADLTTFVGLALLYGWDFYLLANTNYASVFASHDEFLHFYTDSQTSAKAIRKTLTDAKVESRLDRGT